MNTELIARLDTYATCDDYQRDIEAAVMALKAAQAEIERLKGEEYFYQLHFERACRVKYEALALLAALEQQEPVIAVHEDALKELSAANGMNLWAENAQLFEGRSGEHGYNTPLPEGFVNLYAASVATEQSKEWTDENVIAWCIERGIKSAQPSQALLKTTQELASAIAKDEYPDVPQFEVADDLAVVISQIDNMVTGMCRKQPSQAQPDEKCGMCEYIKEVRHTWHPSYTADRMAGPGHTCRNKAIAQPSQARELPKHPVALSRDDTEHGVYYYKASEVDAIIAAINAKEQT